MNGTISDPVQSIIIPTYNRKEMLSEAVASVLNQTQKSLEVIVVDDCSTDGTEEYMKGITDDRVRYIRREEHGGPENNRQLGFRQARGKYITFLDDDDYYTDNEFFAKALKVFSDNADSEPPLSVVCGSGIILKILTGRSREHCVGALGRVSGTEFILRHGIKYCKPPSLFPAVFDGDILRTSGLAGMKIYDTETYLWAMLHGDVYVMPDIAGVYRVHPERNSSGRKLSDQWMKSRMKNLAGRIEICNIILRKLKEISGRRPANKWYAKMIAVTMDFFLFGSASFHYRSKIYFHTVRDSKFMPGLFVMLTWLFTRDNLRRIPVLHKLYRFIRYRCMGKPYPED